MTATAAPRVSVTPPTTESLNGEYAAIERKLDAATDFEQLTVAVEGWDALRRRIRTWQNLVNLRFRQNTKDERSRRDREYADAMEPEIIAHDVAIKRRLLEHPSRPNLEQRFGAQAFRLWNADLRSYAPAIDADLVAESKLTADYNSLFGGISVEFDGRRMTLPELRGYLNHNHRNTRHAAERARWAAIAERGAELDKLFDDLVVVRNRIGKTLGHPSFVPVGYARMQRVDYDAEDVRRWRDTVVSDVVPLASKIIERSGARLGHRIMSWDESVLVPADTNPIVDGPSLVARLPDVLQKVDPRLGDFGKFMRDRQFLDVFSRDGKGPGGFCTSFPTEGHPYIFASFNGSKDDVNVLVHEMGHAFQSYSSRGLALDDYLTATSESAEIHSMSLEFLAWPGMDDYFGDRSDAYRVEHLASRVLFLPYGCAVDHFQHFVYERPDASPEERRAFWLEVQARYLPWRDYGDVSYPALGNAWQQQLHIFTYPFYYIDYTLAQCCALQFWALAERDRRDAVERYVALCARGGSGSFRELVASAGLQSPFDGTALAGVVETAREYLARAQLI